MTDAQYPWIKSYPDAIDWHADIPAGPLHGLLERSEARFPKNTALDFKGKLYSYSELAKKTRRFAKGLQEMGVVKGSKVGLFMPNCPQYVIAYYGALMAGAIVVNYNPLYSKRELEHQLNDSETEIMVTLNLVILYDKLRPFVGKGFLKQVVVGDLPSVLPAAKAILYSMARRKEIASVPKDNQHKTFMDLLDCDPNPKRYPCDAKNDIAVLQYTGGTTGVPKGVMLTHANISANCEQCNLWFHEAKQGEERIMGVLPFFHVFAMTVIMNYGISAGFCIIMHPRFEMKPLLEDVAKKKPALMPGVPTMFTAILNCPTLEKYDLTSLKMCISGGAPLPLEVKQQFEKFTKCKLVEGYGLSETAPVVSCNPLWGENKEGSIGIPLPRTILEVVDKDDETTMLPQGEVGEICIRGPQVMPGYWNKPEETSNVLKGRRLHTGDIGYMDEEGYFFIVDRKKEMIISGGYNIYPRNIEEVLYTHNDILECAVIGIEHKVRGQTPKAFIVLKEGKTATDQDIKDWLKDKLSAYALPSEIEFKDELPKSMIGKILKKELQ